MNDVVLTLAGRAIEGFLTEVGAASAHGPGRPLAVSGPHLAAHSTRTGTALAGELDVTVPYPVTVETRLPARFDRLQVLVRLLVLSVISVLHQTAGGLLGALYFVLPIVVTVLLLQKGRARFLSEDVRWLLSVLEWVVSLYAYLLFVTDRFPLPSVGRDVRVVVQPGTHPTASGALLRLLTSLPHALVLGLLGIAASVVGFVAALSILLVEHYPEPLRTFQRDVLGWMARLFAYHASLVEPYPPLSFGPSETTPPQHDSA